MTEWLNWTESLNYHIAEIQEKSHGGSDQGGSTDDTEKCLIPAMFEITANSIC